MKVVTACERYMRAAIAKTIYSGIMGCLNVLEVFEAIAKKIGNEDAPKESAAESSVSSSVSGISSLDCVLSEGACGVFVEPNGLTCVRYVIVAHLPPSGLARLEQELGSMIKESPEREQSGVLALAQVVCGFNSPANAASIRGSIKRAQFVSESLFKNQG